MSTALTAHPAATPAARALTLLANYQPADADDAANLLAALHDHGNDSVIARLLQAIDAQNSNLYATPGIDESTARRISAHLNAATGIISGAAADWIDKARELLPEPEQGDTDETEGIPSWELNPNPPVENAGPASGHTMLTVPARDVREGDLLPTDSWARVLYVHCDREDDSAHITYRRTDGRVGTLQSVGANQYAILRAEGSAA